MLPVSSRQTRIRESHEENAQIHHAHELYRTITALTLGNTGCTSKWEIGHTRTLRQLLRELPQFFSHREMPEVLLDHDAQAIHGAVGHPDHGWMRRHYLANRCCRRVQSVCHHPPDDVIDHQSQRGSETGKVNIQRRRCKSYASLEVSYIL